MPYQTSTNQYQTTKYIVGGGSPYATVQSAINAANAAGGGVVIIRPGTYTENLTLYTAVTLEGTGNEEIIISGVHTPPVAGITQFTNLTLRSATSIFSSVAAGATSIYVINCYIEVTNGYIFNLANWTGFLSIERCETNGINDGVINNAGSATIYITDSQLGAGVANVFTANGTSSIDQSSFNCALSLSGAGTITFNLCKFSQTVTLAGTLVSNITNSQFITGAGIALTSTTAGLVSLSDIVINSAAVNVITGTSTIEMGSITYLNSTGIAGTITKDFTTRHETGVLKIADTSTGALSATTGVVSAGTLVVGYGGTGQTTLLDHGILVGSGAAAIDALVVGNTGELLVGISGADPAFGSSANGSFSFTSATAGVDRWVTIINTDNTNPASQSHLWIETGGAVAGDPYLAWQIAGVTTYSMGIDNSVAGDPIKITSGASPSVGTDLFTMTSTGVITLNNDLDVTEGGTGVSTFTSHGILIGNGAGDIQATAEPSNGQLLIGKTGFQPVLASITAGAGIVVTPGAGTITIAATGLGATWVEANADTNLAVNTGYITKHATPANRLIYTLPLTAAQGDSILILGYTTGGWRIAQNAGQQIFFGTRASTVGVGGYVQSTQAKDDIALLCITANTEWVIRNDVGNITIA